MGSGNYTIYEWLREGKSMEWIVNRLKLEYPQIPKYRLRLLVQHIRVYGEDKPNPHWKVPNEEAEWRRKLSE